MKFRITFLCLFFLLFSISVTVYAKDDSQVNDYIYLKKIGVDGVYFKVTGKFNDITENLIYMENDIGENLLFERKSVKQVKVDRPVWLKKTNEENWIKRNEWQQIVKKYWNRDSSLSLTFLINLPGIGNALKFLNYLSARLANFLAFVILLPIILYGIYRLYESSIVFSQTRQMNNEKLVLEIRKLKYDVGRIEERLGIVVHEESMRQSLVPDEKKSFYQGIEIPKLEIVDFIKQKILRFPQEEYLLAEKKAWLTKWVTYEAWKPWTRYLVYSVHMMWNTILIIFASLMGIGALPNLFTFIGNYGEAGGLGLFIFMLGVFYGSIVSLIKLKYSRKLIHETYKQAFKCRT